MPAAAPRVEAIDRALVILTTLSEMGSSGGTLGEVAQRAGANKATTYRALCSLTHRGFAEQRDDGSYRLGPAAILLGDGHPSPRALAQDLHPALTALSAATHELVHLGALTGDQVIYLDKVEPDKPIQVRSAVGKTMFASSTALGRAWLASLPLTDKQLDVYLAHHEDPAGAREELASVLRATRERGWSVEIEENEPGIACWGTAVLHKGRPVAALSVTTMTDSLDAARQEWLARVAREVIPPLLPEGMRLLSGQPE